MKNEVTDFLKKKEKEQKNNLIYKDILDNEDIQALDMLINENKMTNSEKRHYLIGVDWKSKIKKLENDELFNKQEIKAIKKLVSEEKLTIAEKRYYILGTNIQEKLEKLKIEVKSKLKTNNPKKIRSNKVPDINTLIEGDKILMEFKEHGKKEHFWCNVTKIENNSSKSGNRMITISFIDDDNLNNKNNNIIKYGLLNEISSSLYNYCKNKYDNLKIGEKSYNKRVLEVKKSNSIKTLKTKSSKFKI